MRPPQVLLLAVLLALAGCTTPTADVAPADVVPSDPGVEVVGRTALPEPAPPADGSNATPAARAARLPTRIPFAEPVALPIVGSIGAGEPNIAVLPRDDGSSTIFVTSPTGLQAAPNAVRGAAYLWRSTDGGATWETLREPAESPVGFGPFCSCDADVVTSPDGWVYFSDWWNGNYLVEASPDGGDTWTSAPVTTREAVLLTTVDRQWLVAGEDGFVGLFYSRSIPLVSLGVGPSDVRSGIHAVFSYDHGATWGQPVLVLDEGSWQIAHPRILPSGTLVMPYGFVESVETFWRDPSLVRVAVSTDAGSTWEHHDVANAPEGFDNLWAVQADFDATGALHVAWSARVDDDHMATWVATSRDAGATWTEPLALRETGLNFLPWVAATGDGTVAVGWYGGNATGEPEDADDDWFAYVAESTDGGETFVVHRVSETPVKSGPLCPRGASCDGDRELLDYVSLAYGRDGRLHYAFARSEDGVAITNIASEILDVVE